jgi:hypothetical protein
MAVYDKLNCTKFTFIKTFGKTNMYITKNYAADNYGNNVYN